VNFGDEVMGHFRRTWYLVVLFRDCCSRRRAWLCQSIGRCPSAKGVAPSRKNAWQGLSYSAMRSRASRCFCSRSTMHAKRFKQSDSKQQYGRYPMRALHSFPRSPRLL